MGTFLDVDDLAVFADIPLAKATAMIEDAEAMALLAAPCINTEGFAYATAVKAILRGAILRWNEAGTGALQSQNAGIFGQTVDTRQERRGMFWPSEIVALQSLCADATGGVYTTSLAGPERGDGYWSQPKTWTPL
ncbi:MAG: hypothetical protein ACRED4_07205 [Brevundimonas sp.]